jgi:hypothetical protein
MLPSSVSTAVAHAARTVVIVAREPQRCMRASR